MLKNLKNFTGETIVEIIIAILIILLALTTSFKVLSLAFTQKEFTRNKIMAINLAREGMEAVRYIRDYNWYYYGNNKRICWNHYQDNNDNGNLDLGVGGDLICSEEGDKKFAQHQIGSHSGSKQEYILKQKGSHWFLTRNTKNGTKLSNGDFMSLNVNNLGLGSSNANNISQSYQLCESLDLENRYVSCLNQEKVSYSKTNSNRTKYFRAVFIEYDNDPQDFSNGYKVNEMKVSVIVKWVNKGVVKDVELITKLTDFYQRTDNDS